MCVRASVRACVCACARVRVRVRVCARPPAIKTCVCVHAPRHQGVCVHTAIKVCESAGPARFPPSTACYLTFLRYSSFSRATLDSPHFLCSVPADAPG